MLCLLIINNFKEDIDNKIKSELNNCTSMNMVNIYKEIYSRLIKPIYITFLISVSLLLILKSKSDHTFKAQKFRIYALGFFSIIFLYLFMLTGIQRSFSSELKVVGVTNLCIPLIKKF